MSRSIFVLLLAITLGCASSSSRKVASDPTPVSEEQFQNIADLGIGLLRFSILSNVIDRETKVDEALQAKLAQIDNGTKQSVRTTASIVGGVGLVGSILGGYQLVAEALVGSLFDASSGGTTGVQTNFMSSAGGTLVVVAGSALVANSSGAFKSLGAGKRSAEEVAAEKQRLQFQRELQSTVAGLSKLYGQIFSLNNGTTVAFRTKLREEIMSGARASRGEKVRIDVPALMAREKLISEAAYGRFREKVNQIEIAARTPGEVSKVLTGENYAANVEEVKLILRAYIAWVKESLPTMRENSAIRASCLKAVDDGERLLQRI